MNTRRSENVVNALPGVVESHDATSEHDEIEKRATPVFTTDLTRSITDLS